MFWVMLLLFWLVLKNGVVRFLKNCEWLLLVFLWMLLKIFSGVLVGFVLVFSISGGMVLISIILVMCVLLWWLM